MPSINMSGAGSSVCLEVGEQVLASLVHLENVANIRECLSQFVDHLSNPMFNPPPNPSDREVISGKSVSLSGVPGVVKLDDGTVQWIQKFADEVGINELDLLRLWVQIKSQVKKASKIASATDMQDSVEEVYFIRKRTLVRALLEVLWLRNQVQTQQSYATGIASLMEAVFINLRNQKLVSNLIKSIGAIIDGQKIYENSFKGNFTREILQLLLLCLWNSRSSSVDFEYADVEQLLNLLEKVSFLCHVKSNQSNESAQHLQIVHFSFIVLYSTFVEYLLNQESPLKSQIKDFRPRSQTEHSALWHQVFILISVFTDNTDRLLYVDTLETLSEALSSVIAFSQNDRECINLSIINMTVTIIRYWSKVESMIASNQISISANSSSSTRMRNSTKYEGAAACKRWRFLSLLCDIGGSRANECFWSGYHLENFIFCVAEHVPLGSSLSIELCESFFPSVIRSRRHKSLFQFISLTNYSHLESIPHRRLFDLLCKGTNFGWFSMFHELNSFSNKYQRVSQFFSYDQTSFYEQKYSQHRELSPSIPSNHLKFLTGLIRLITEMAHDSQVSHTLIYNQQFQVLKLFISLLRCDVSVDRPDVLYGFRMSVLDGITAFIRSDASNAVQWFHSIHSAIVCHIARHESEFGDKSQLVFNALQSFIPLDARLWQKYGSKSVASSFIQLFNVILELFFIGDPEYLASDKSFLELIHYISYSIQLILPVAIQESTWDWNLITQCLQMLLLLFHNLDLSDKISNSSTLVLGDQIVPMAQDPRILGLQLVFSSSKMTSALITIVSNARHYLSQIYRGRPDQFISIPNKSTRIKTLIEHCLENVLCLYLEINQKESILEQFIAECVAGPERLMLDCLTEVFPVVPHLQMTPEFLFAICGFVREGISTGVIYLSLCVLSTLSDSTATLKMLRSSTSGYEEFSYNINQLVKHINHQPIIFQNCRMSMLLESLVESLGVVSSRVLIPETILQFLLHHSKYETPNMTTALFGLRLGNLYQNDTEYSGEVLLESLFELIGRSGVSKGYPSFSVRIFELFSELLHRPSTNSLLIHRISEEYPYTFVNVLKTLDIRPTMDSYQIQQRQIAASVLQCIALLLHYQLSIRSRNQYTPILNYPFILDQLGLSSQESFRISEDLSQSQSRSLISLNDSTTRNLFWLLEAVDPIHTNMIQEYEEHIIQALGSAVGRSIYLGAPKWDVSHVLIHHKNHIGEDLLDKVTHDMSVVNLMSDAIIANGELFLGWQKVLEVFAFEYLQTVSDHDLAPVFSLLDIIFEKLSNPSWLPYANGLSSCANTLLHAVRVSYKVVDEGVLMVRKRVLGYIDKLRIAIEVSSSSDARMHLLLCLRTIHKFTREKNLFEMGSWELVVTHAFNDTLRGHNECQAVALTFLSEYLDCRLPAKKPLDELISWCGEDFVHRLVDFLIERDSQFFEAVITPGFSTSENKAFLVLRAFILLFMTIAQINEGSQLLLDAHLLEYILSSQYMRKLQHLSLPSGVYMHSSSLEALTAGNLLEIHSLWLNLVQCMLTSEVKNAGRSRFREDRNVSLHQLVVCLFDESHGAIALSALDRRSFSSSPDQIMNLISSILRSILCGPIGAVPVLQGILLQLPVFIYEYGILLVKSFRELESFRNSMPVDLDNNRLSRKHRPLLQIVNNLVCCAVRVNQPQLFQREGVGEIIIQLLDGASSEILVCKDLSELQYLLRICLSCISLLSRHESSISEHKEGRVDRILHELEHAVKKREKDSQAHPQTAADLVKALQLYRR